jgi:hypothetical protein
MPSGKEYKHPEYGVLKFDAARLERFANSVKTKVRGIDPDIDYDHKARTGEAAGWVKNAEARPDGLWLQVEWTPPAAQRIKNKEYRYFSPEFYNEWTDAQGVKHTDVLFGGGLTNRPFLKDLIPVNLSELSFKEETGMDPKELRKKLGLPEDAPEAAVTAKLEELLKAPSAPEPPKVDPPTPTPPVATDAEKELAKLAETNPAIKLLLENQATQAKQLAETQKLLVMTETSNKLTEINTHADNKYALAPVFLDELKTVLPEIPKVHSDKIVGLLKKLTDGTGLVQLGEVGGTSGQRQDPGTSGSAAKAFDDAVEKIQLADPKMSYVDAVEKVNRDQPDLWGKRLNEMYSGVTA